MQVKSFNSFQEMTNYLSENEKNRVELMEEMSFNGTLPKVNIGDYFLYQSCGLVILGQVKDPLEWYNDKVLGKDYEQYEYDGEKHSQEYNTARGLHYSMCYSEACPDGECGSVSVHQMQIIDKETAMRYAIEKNCNIKEIL